MVLLNAELIVPGDHDSTLHYAVDHFITVARDSIQDHGFFFVALSGGSTPREIYEILAEPPYDTEIEWDRVHLFWSDERNVPPDHPDSNYRMAMQSGFNKLSLIPEHIHRMEAETSIEKNAMAYEKRIRKILQDRSFDLVMLGMGEDGHTASLFPGTEALLAHGRQVMPNFIPAKKTWRMTLTLDCINSAAHIVVYVMGETKKEMLKRVFTTKSTLPCQLVGTDANPALWIADSSAAELLTRCSNR